jgi:hypothetical protein
MTRLLPLVLTAVALTGCAKALPTAPPRAVKPVQAQALTPAKFFANAAVQAEAPAAFAVSPAALPALEAVERVAPAQRAALVAAIRADKALAADVAAFPALGWDRQRKAIERIMALESRAFGAQPPPLVVHDEDGRGPAFFEFDPATPGTGTVHLWPKQLAQETSPHAALLLAIHETRHSWQFQLATGFAGVARREPVLAQAFMAGFKAQQALSGKLSFCDFCTMHHEHEAFQTGNAVVGELTGWTADASDMGCYSSQFTATGAAKIDLLDLARRVGPAGLLKAFNQAERAQFEALGGSGT